MHIAQSAPPPLYFTATGIDTEKAILKYARLHIHPGACELRERGVAPSSSLRGSYWKSETRSR